ncbi:uncharacterized protein involved in outer membrane biogenesis [Bradyrhizobium sp. LM4.3]
MTYANNGRQTLQATLAADVLDFTPYISTFRLLASGARDWNRQLFDLNALSTTDLDMRLSAAKLTVGASKLGRTAIGANLRNGTLALSVGEAQVYGGIAKGSFGIARSDTVADIKAQVSSSPTSTSRPAPPSCSVSTSCPAAATSTSRSSLPARARSASCSRSTAAPP